MSPCDAGNIVAVWIELPFQRKSISIPQFNVISSGSQTEVTHHRTNEQQK